MLTFCVELHFILAEAEQVAEVLGQETVFRQVEEAAAEPRVVELLQFLPI